jgi:peptidoglycan hydrolase-like protein with peptidoglycan-binding domain
MKPILIAVALLGVVFVVRADQAISDVQQVLKDQGFYYGEVSGEKNADTTAAIRRFQIRNGLQVTGELNDETLRALGIGGGARPPVQATPANTPDNSDLRNDSGKEPASPRPSQRVRPPENEQEQPQDRQSEEPGPSGRAPVYQGRPGPAPIPNDSGGGIFTGTPYATAPPEVQHDVIVSAQTRLARQGLYRAPVDGVFGPNMEFSLRAYQSRFGLPATGRLDLQTLAALELLPGSNRSIYVPRRRIWRQPPVRGQWVPE